MQQKDITAALGVNQDIIDQRKMQVANRQVSIACVLPIKNEQDHLADFIAQLAAYLQSVADIFEIIVVDDGSTDSSLQIAQSSLSQINGSGRLISLSRNFGKEAAISAGLQAVRADVAVIMDADFQHPFSTIESFLRSWSYGYDHIYAVKSDLKKESIGHRFGRRLFHGMLKASSRFDIPYGAGDFRLFDCKVVQALNSCTEQDKFMKGLYAFVGFRSQAIPYEVLPRRSGKSRFSQWRLTRFAMSGFLSFSDLPLRVWSVMGFLVALVAFISALYIIIDTLILGVKVPGYTTLIVVIIFFGGIQLLSIGILGEYISRIFREVKPRPAFLIQDKTDLGKPWQQ